MSNKSNKNIKSKNSLSILEVNYIDLPGKRWNGYDITEYINNHTNHHASQIVIHKLSDNKDVKQLFSGAEQQLYERIVEFENNHLSVHSCLSCSSPALLTSKAYKKADVVHLHLIHNMKLSIVSLIEICNNKPTIITIHDPWFFTGRCVWLYDCKKYLTGCHNCPNLNNLFPLKCDNCHELWNLKKNVYQKIDPDFIVTTKYMENLFKESPLTKNKRVHIIPFGINTNEFYHKYTQQEAKKHYSIPNDHIVLFHRAQLFSKGTEYVVEALDKLKTNQKVTIITCSEKGRLDTLKNKYNIIELGETDSQELAYAYNACDIFLSPSIGESFCMMAVEAMSCEKPVIIFNNTALPSVTFAPNCGVLVKDRDSNDLMDKIKWLIDNKEERIKRGKLGRKLVCEHYDLNTYNKQIIKLYETVAKRKTKKERCILDNKIIETPSTKTLKQQLNLLTKSIAPKHSELYKKIIYDIPKSTKKIKFNIKYGDINTQLLINQYNNQLFHYVKTYHINQFYSSQYAKIKHKAKTLTSLIIHDHKKIIQIIKNKS